MFSNNFKSISIIRALDHVGILTALFGTLVSFITEIFHCQAVSYIRIPQIQRIFLKNKYFPPFLGLAHRPRQLGHGHLYRAGSAELREALQVRAIKENL